jgi:sphingomyelin phosphodiesterase
MRHPIFVIIWLIRIPFFCIRYENTIAGQFFGHLHNDQFLVYYDELDHRTVIMNLTASNIYNKTIFADEYNARDAYQIENLFPEDWNNLIERLQNDIDGPLMDSAYEYYTKSYANGTQCNHSCRRRLLCAFKTARSEDPNACASIPHFLQ